MRASYRHSMVLFVGLLVAMSGTLACSGGDASGDTPLAGSCLDLSATAGGQQTVSLDKGTSTCDMLAIDVVVTDVSDVFATSFTLSYDETLARFEDVSTSGSLLASDGTTVQVLEDAQTGRVTIGLTRLGVSTGVNAVGTQRLVTLMFSSLADAGDTGISFSNQTILGSEAPPVDKSSVSWVGGTLVLR